MLAKFVFLVLALSVTVLAHSKHWYKHHYNKGDLSEKEYGYKHKHYGHKHHKYKHREYLALDEEDIDAQEGNDSGSEKESYGYKKKKHYKEKESYGCTNGHMKCKGTGFNTCDHHTWVYRECGKGTACKQNGKGVYCDYAR
ncbi:hypothetical protein HK099_002938 [Clydaea vesicula]|uniref:Uncharacterized protein n=1 Tax=Clydaea vesicula TaxID=447962 RepID=A0AAD5Y3A7_9FUNG|nr:hypothetical protein HK099_002938 [Clydaea vesicula]KAJ3379165.1 hypothetical protein HDU92_006855 [Lobulomyces angularis]